nr:hypothetical protein [Tanacetum cinerariifolium]
MQSQTSNSLHNAIMEAGSKDRPPMLALGNYIQWKSRIKHKFIIDAEGNPTTATHQVFETYQNVAQVIRNQLNAKVEAVQIILTCPNAFKMWKAIERLKQGESINPEWQRFVTLVKQSQELKHVSYHKLYDILKQHQHEVNEIRADKIVRVANPLALVAQQQQVSYHQIHPTHFNQNSSTRTHQSTTRKREKAVVNSPQPIYDQEPSMVDDDEDTSKDKEIDKLMALISLSFKKIYKPTNNNLRTSSNTSRANQDNSPRIHRNVGMKEYGHVARECQKPKRAKDAAYHREKMLLCKQEEAGIQLNAEQADWRDDTDDESDDQELEAHYMYMAKIQLVSPDVDDSGPIFDKEPEQKVQNDDHYDVFAIDCQHSEQSKSVHNTYLLEQDAQSVSIESEDMNYDSEQIEQHDEDVDLAKEYFKNKNKSLTEANNKLSEVNAHLYADYKKSKDELKHRNTIKYATEMELECAKLRARMAEICDSSEAKSRAEDNSPRIHRNTGYEGQRSGTVAGARDTVGSSMVQNFRIQCYNCKEYGHVARECQKPKRAKDVAYHRDKMLLCKQEEAGIQLNAEQADWRDDTDNE